MSRKDVIIFSNIIKQIEDEVYKKKIKVCNKVSTYSTVKYWGSESIVFLTEKCYEDALNIVKRILANGECIMNINCSDITNVNVIVPKKVVEVTFADGEKEKMICHKDDTFDLRNCLFIAIAKHLYKKEYTFEGIEWKAFEFTHMKKYVKIVDSALKAYYRKQNEIAKAEEERVERLKHSEARHNRKLAKKAKREQEKRERQIAIQREAYLQAVKVMKEEENV